jgi:hypothetical protein
MIFEHMADKTFAAILEHHQGMHVYGLQATDEHQEFIHADDFANGLAAFYKPIEVAAIAHGADLASSSSIS